MSDEVERITELIERVSDSVLEHKEVLDELERIVDEVAKALRRVEGVERSILCITFFEVVLRRLDFKSFEVAAMMEFLKFKFLHESLINALLYTHLVEERAREKEEMK